MPGDEIPKSTQRSIYSIMDDVPPVKRSVSAAALLAARTGQPQPEPEPKPKAPAKK